jgi:hypothetical protein
MNQQTFDKLVQKSRQQSPLVLYEGSLQLNTDQYLRPTNLNSQTKIAPAPPAIFCENGATVELDKRMFSVLQPQVPSNPELEALNSYFNQKRVNDFARGQAKLITEEVIRKQGEDFVSQAVKDEIDRRAGIRRQVLDLTGLTPAQIDQQLVAESLAGINPRTLDMRNTQITDAVNRFYNLAGFPVPQTQQVTSGVPATIPTIASPAVRVVEEAVEEAVVAPQLREAPPAPPMARPRAMNRQELVDFIIAKDIRTDETLRRDGRLKASETIMALGLVVLNRIVDDYFVRINSANPAQVAGGVRNNAV